MVTVNNNKPNSMRTLLGGGFASVGPVLAWDPPVLESLAGQRASKVVFGVVPHNLVGKHHLVTTGGVVEKDVGVVVGVVALSDPAGTVERERTP
eukprot:m.461675 g.461675  ORF g.461675 m.461675 type:complete len:94 (+) comp22373_c0_seq1:142-423(+)